MSNSKVSKLSKIKETAFSRGLALAKVSMSAGAKVASHAVGSIFASQDSKEDRVRALLMSQVSMLTRELGQLKGSAMKMGQMLSVYGEHFLPPEVNSVLKSLQNQSPPLEWKAIEKTVNRQFTVEQLAQLELDHEPMASASLGQVHRATLKATGEALAVKIQYPGVDQAIEGDLKAIRSILSLSKLIPKIDDFDEIFKEVKQMLHQEVDYSRELEFTEEYRKALGDDSRYIIPKTYPQFSTKRILVTSYEEGVAVDSPEVKALSQERRNRLAELALDLYFRELFEFGMVQTDPHFGNYKVRLDPEGKNDQLILFDFGATRKLSQTFLKKYYRMVTGAHLKDREMLLEGAELLGFVREDDSEEHRQSFVDLCILFTEPFSQGANYDWGKSDLPKRVATQGSQLVFSMKLREPPRELVFLDRKLGGIYIFLAVLGAKFDARPTIQRYIKEI